MKMSRVIASAAALAVAGLSAGGAQAAQYMVSYTSTSGPGVVSQFAGTFTTTDVANAQGFFTVTGLSGARNGLAATLAAVDSIGGNDNLFKPTANYFNVNGVGYSAGGTLYNPYFGTSGTLLEFGSGGTISNFVVSQVNGAVPEPATWAMMIMGFAMIGFGMRYSMRKSNAKFDLKVKRIAAGLEA